MEVEGRLVGEHVHIVMMNVHAVRHLLDDDASGAVTNEPVQQGFLLSRHDLGDERHVPERLLDLVDGVEITRHPQRKFERGDVFRAFDRFVDERGVAGEIQAGDGQTMFIGAVEIHRPIGHDHTHADHRVRLRLAARTKHRVIVVAARSNQDGLPI